MLCAKDRPNEAVNAYYNQLIRILTCLAKISKHVFIH